MKLEILYLGRIHCKKLHLVSTPDPAQEIYSPMVGVLIRHPELGTILYDTGNSPFYRTEYSAEMLETYPIDQFISIEDALAEKGLTPEDIDLLIISHLHFDHAGGLRYFRKSPAFEQVYVSDADLKEAYASTMSGEGGAYIKSLFDIPGICFHRVHEDLNLASDLRLFIQRSHTPGCMGMVVETEEEGTIIFTSDTVYTQESYDAALAPGGSINKTQSEFFDNLQVIQKMREELDATLFFGHDYQQVMEWKDRGAIS